MNAKKALLMAFIVMLPLATLGALVPGRETPTRYVSVWTYVPPGEVYVFRHGLDARPLILNVWIAHFVGDKTDSVPPPDWNEAYPYTQSGLIVQTVNLEFISVLNTEDVGLFVQVLAEK